MKNYVATRSIPWVSRINSAQSFQSSFIKHSRTTVLYKYKHREWITVVVTLITSLCLSMYRGTSSGTLEPNRSIRSPTDQTPCTRWKWKPETILAEIFALQPIILLKKNIGLCSPSSDWAICCSGTNTHCYHSNYFLTLEPEPLNHTDVDGIGR